MAAPQTILIQMKRQADVTLQRFDATGNPVMTRPRRFEDGPPKPIFDTKALFPGQFYDLPEDVAKVLMSDGAAASEKLRPVKLPGLVAVIEQRTQVVEQRRVAA